MNHPAVRPATPSVQRWFVDRAEAQRPEISRSAERKSRMSYLLLIVTPGQSSVRNGVNGNPDLL
jgi:hypothetical protein